MIDAAAATHPSIPAAPAAARALLDRQLAILGRLAEAGLEIAVALEAQAKGGAVVVEGDVAMAYGRVARAVRQTLMLQSRLIEGLQARSARRAAAGASAARILRGVIDDAAEGGDPERAERLSAEAAERLRAEDFAEVLALPFGEAVAQIVRDLGLSPDWLALAEDCFAAEAALDARPAARARAGPADLDDDPRPIEVQWLPASGPAARGSDSS